MPRDPRDVAIDALVQSREATKRYLAVLDARILELQDGPHADTRKHVCPHPGCGLRFYREDQVADHLALVHQERA